MHPRLKGLLVVGALAGLLPVIPPLVATVAARDIVVNAGDTLTAIAQREHTSIARIVALNRLRDPNLIYAGQRLHVSPPASTAGAKTTKPQPASGAAAWHTYRVRPGDTLTGIARRFGTSIAALVRANGIRNPSFIRIGKVLRVPPRVRPAAAPSAPQPARHVSMSAAMASTVAQRAAVGRVIEAEARRYGVPRAFALAVAWQESGWQQSVTSYAGAIGIMQLLPATAEWVSGMLNQRVNPYNAQHNVRAGVRLLRHYLDRYHGDKAKTLAAYYQGQTAVDRHGIYPVSRPYIASILLLERIFAS